MHRFTVALRLLHHLEPAGVGARDLAECLTLQLQRACRPTSAATTAPARPRCAICQQPMDLLARRDVKRLAQLCGEQRGAASRRRSA